MKKLLIVFILFVFYVSLNAQCDKVNYQSEFYDLKKTYFVINNYLGKPSIYFFLKEEDCIDENQTGLLFFEDGTNFQFLHNTSFNCKGSFSALISKEFSDQLCRKDLSSICISTMNKSHCSTLTEVQKNILKKEVDCLVLNGIIK